LACNKLFSGIPYISLFHRTQLYSRVSISKCTVNGSRVEFQHERNIKWMLETEVLAGERASKTTLGAS